MKMHLLFVLAATLCCGTVSAYKESRYEVGTRGGNKLPYAISVPDDYATSKKKYALVIGLHGGGARGTNLGNVHVGYGADLEKVIMMAPRSAGGWCAEGDPANLISIVEYEKTQLRIDEDKVFVTGYSAGGQGTYGMINRYPNYFAAAGPVAAYGSWVDVQSLSHLPIWCNQGERDGSRVHQITIDRLRCPSVLSPRCTYDVNSSIGRLEFR